MYILNVHIDYNVQKVTRLDIMDVIQGVEFKGFALANFLTMHLLLKFLCMRITAL